MVEVPGLELLATPSLKSSIIIIIAHKFCAKRALPIEECGLGYDGGFGTVRVYVTKTQKIL